MPSTNRSRLSGSALIRLAVSRRPPSNVSCQAGIMVSELAHPAAKVVGGQGHDLAAEAVEERGVPRLVHELGGEEQLDLAARRRQQERSEVRGDALLPDVERPEAPSRVGL